MDGMSKDEVTKYNQKMERNREIEKLKELLDKFAGLAMQSLMQHWLQLDGKGLTRDDFASKDEFWSLASSAMATGWSSCYPNARAKEYQIDHADQLANKSYFIASAMLKWRLEYIEDMDFNELLENSSDEKSTDAQTTEETAGSENPS
jgi:hypothetical protein